jgi:hypothetical protein
MRSVSTFRQLVANAIADFIGCSPLHFRRNGHIADSITAPAGASLPE